MLEVDRLVGDNDTPVKVLMEHFHGRVYTLMLVFLSLPFCQPIVLPGLSTPFGTVITLLGIRYAFGFHPWLPDRLLNTTIPANLLHTILRAGSKVLRQLERFLHPRMTWVCEFRLSQCAAGLMIAISGFCLLLPLPVPLSNLMPAISIVITSAALSERDGLMYLVGAFVFFINVLFFAAIAIGGTELVNYLWDLAVSHFRGVPPPPEPMPANPATPQSLP